MFFFRFSIFAISFCIVDSLVWSGPVRLIFQPSGFVWFGFVMNEDVEHKREDHYLIAIIDLLMLS